MRQATLSVRIDENIKHQFDCFCEDAGMNTSVAINLFIRAVIRNQKIPFDIIGNIDPFYSEKNQARIREAIKRLEEGMGVEHELIEVDDDEENLG
jgi:DNA-damage-inducible protein J